MEMKICHNCRMEHPVEYTCAQVQQDTQRSPMLLQHARSRYYQALGDLDHVADSYHYAEARLQTRREQLKMMAERELEPPPELMQELERMKELEEQSRKSQIKAVLADLKLNPRKGYSVDESYTRGGTVTGRISSAQRSYEQLPRPATYPDPSARRDAQHEQALTQPAARFDPFKDFVVVSGANPGLDTVDGLKGDGRHPLQRATEQPGWDGQSKWRPWE